MEVGLANPGPSRRNSPGEQLGAEDSGPSTPTVDRLPLAHNPKNGAEWGMGPTSSEVSLVPRTALPPWS